MPQPDTTPRWRFEHGSYYLYGPSGNIRCMTDRVAIGYDFVGDKPVLVKHGAPEMVEAWCEKAAGAYRNAGFDPEVAMVTFPSDFPVEEINRCIDTSGYIGVVLERVEREHADGEAARED